MLTIFNLIYDINLETGKKREIPQEKKAAAQNNLWKVAANEQIKKVNGESNPQTTDELKIEKRREKIRKHCFWPSSLEHAIKRCKMLIRNLLNLEKTHLEFYKTFDWRHCAPSK